MDHRVLLRLPAHSICIPTSTLLARTSASRTPGAASAARHAELVRSSRP